MPKIERELRDAMQSIIDLRAEVKHLEECIAKAVSLIKDLQTERDALKTETKVLKKRNGRIYKEMNHMRASIHTPSLN